MALQNTLEKFGYPKNLLYSSQYWHILLRPQQTTIGAMILICREEVTSYAEISESAIIDQHRMIQKIEPVLSKQFQQNKINYLMLMMVDPEVHFHCVPRYNGSRQWLGNEYEDAGWPALPDLRSSIELSGEHQAELIAILKTAFVSL
jgi:diadenosine tetraphosphate (Ap4A) HIT family hydrolase